MKVGREEIVGLIVALRRYVAGSDEADLERWQQLLDPIVSTFEDLPEIEISRYVPDHKPVPMLRIDLQGDDRAGHAYEIVNRLRETPAIAIDQSHAEHGRLQVNPMGPTEEEACAIAWRVREELLR